MLPLPLKPDKAFQLEEHMPQTVNSFGRKGQGILISFSILGGRDLLFEAVKTKTKRVLLLFHCLVFGQLTSVVPLASLHMF